MRMLWVGAFALFGACHAGGWHLTHEVHDLARETRVGGMFVLEVDANGNLVNADAQIDPSRVPAKARAGADREVPGPVAAAEREYGAGKLYWEIEKVVDGRTVMIVVDDDGNVIGKEIELAQSAWPPEVIAAVNRAVPEGNVTMVELVTGPEALGGTEYHVKKDVGGELLRVSVLADGRIGRMIRKVKAEVRVLR